jgi:hypothetical protein
MAKTGTYGIKVNAYNGVIVLENFANLDFASDTEAGDGGVPLGGIYHTAGALKVRRA